MLEEESDSSFVFLAIILFSTAITEENPKLRVEMSV